MQTTKRNVAKLKRRKGHGSNAPYSLAAMCSIALLVGVIAHKGMDGPFGVRLDSVTASQTSSTYDTFEIIYFGTPDCRKCLDWKKNELPKWRQARLSRQIRLTQRLASCEGESKYTSVCKMVFAETDRLPAFALVHQRSGRVLAAGTGVDGFYRVAKQAQKWAEHWAKRERTA